MGQREILNKILDEAIKRERDWNLSNPLEVQAKYNAEAAERAQGREDFYVLRDGGVTGPLAFLSARKLMAPGAKLLAVVEDYEE